MGQGREKQWRKGSDRRERSREKRVKDGRMYEAGRESEAGERKHRREKRGVLGLMGTGGKGDLNAK